MYRTDVFFPSSLAGLFLCFLFIFVLFLFFPVSVMLFSDVKLTDDGTANL